ncbi:tyrosine-type recombinase/integrase [Intrasporangium calvum]|uniref:tyrosine-type recombinase/integrase n=1 Tax=Intrasporangium calvum TaxID=53358 RepID=UPI003BF4BE1D
MLRPVSGKPSDRRDVYRMVARIAKAAGIPRHISPHSLRHAAITNALDAGVPLRDAQILPRHADPRTTEHYDRGCCRRRCHQPGTALPGRWGADGYATPTLPARA